MLSKIGLSALLMIGVIIACSFAGGLFLQIDMSIAAFVGGFIREYAVALGAVAGLWFYFSR